MDPRSIFEALLVIFSAGMAWGSYRAAVREMRADLNGLGTRLNSLSKREDSRKIAFDLAIMLNAKDPEKEKTTEILAEK